MNLLVGLYGRCNPMTFSVNLAHPSFCLDYLKYVIAEVHVRVLFFFSHNIDKKEKKIFRFMHMHRNVKLSF